MNPVYSALGRDNRQQKETGMKKNFLLCGFTGWCLEILFTAFDSFRRRELQLMGKTSLWMFPIYGMAAFFKPFCHLMKRLPALIRAFFYSCFIFLGEYVSGSILKKYQMCPWDYSSSPANIKGVIRLDYAPLWMIAGLIFEKLLTKSPAKQEKKSY
jgi:uncharacterized membrane protein